MALLAVYVTPKSAHNALVGWHNTAEGKSELLVKLCAAPTDGKANEALLKLLAKELGIPKSALQIKNGHASRHKLLYIECEQYLLEEKIKRAFTQIP